MQDQLAIDVSYEDLHAYHDKMSKTLRLTGTCRVEGGGFHLTVVPAKPRGINDRMLHFELRFAADGESPTVLPLEYTQPWNDEGIQYEEVEFSIGGEVKADAPPALKIEELE